MKVKSLKTGDIFECSMLEDDFALNTPRSSMRGKAGDYLVKTKDGYGRDAFWPIPAKHFPSLYEVVE
jgi:hypothetical protein